jgi:hypothetical protein
MTFLISQEPCVKKFFCFQPFPVKLFTPKKRLNGGSQKKGEGWLIVKKLKYFILPAGKSIFCVELSFQPGTGNKPCSF